MKPCLKYWIGITCYCNKNNMKDSLSKNYLLKSITKDRDNLDSHLG